MWAILSVILYTARTTQQCLSIIPAFLYGLWFSAFAEINSSCACVIYALSACKYLLFPRSVAILVYAVFTITVMCASSINGRRKRFTMFINVGGPYAVRNNVHITKWDCCATVYCDK